MKLSAKEKLVLEYVKRSHGDQKRKYTGEPYWTHPYAVAEKLSEMRHHYLVVPALLHDVVEDTTETVVDVLRELISCGYPTADALHYTTVVDELTEEFTKENYPTKNRVWRKEREADRFIAATYDAQCIKAVDLWHNTQSIVEHDKDFAKIYLKEKHNLLFYLMDADDAILEMVSEQLSEENYKIGAF